MTPELWKKVCSALDLLQPMPATDRASELKQLWNSDPILAAEVESLLSQNDADALDLDGVVSHVWQQVKTDNDAPITAALADPDLVPPFVPGVTLKGGKENVKFGGMGVVYFGTDFPLRRRVAVKVLRRRLGHSPEMAARFEAEAQVCAQLQHPCIVPVYQVGKLVDGRPFYTMKMVKGDTLADLLRKRSSPMTDLLLFLTHFRRVCDAMAYAHAHKVLHRDLKPSNIMVGDYGEVMLMDWGLAKVLGEGTETEATPEPASRAIAVDPGDSDPTPTKGALGTLAYMPPEQAAGLVDQVDKRSDVFGLGAILCAILTGQPPYIGPTEGIVERKALRGDLGETFERLAECGADAELIALVRICLAGRREERPADASVVAQMIAEHIGRIQDRLQQAEFAKVAADVRATEERKRRKVWVGLMGSLAVLFGVVGLGAWWIDRKNAHAENEREKHELEVLFQRKQKDTEVRLEREQRAAETLKDVEVGLANIAKLRDQSRWLDVRAELARARMRIQGLNNHDLEKRVSQAERDTELAAKLEDIRLQKFAIVDGKMLGQEVGPGYGRAFADAGIGRPDDDPSVVASRIRESAIARQLIDSLDDWLLDSTDEGSQPNTKGATRTRWLKQILAAADQNSFANEIRGTVLSADKPTLQKFADQMDITKSSPSMIVFVASSLHKKGGMPFPLLTRAAIQYPSNDSLILYQGIHLLLDKRYAEAQPYFYAVLAIREQMPAAWLFCCSCLFLQANWDDSLAAGKKLVSLMPNELIGNFCVGTAYINKREYDAALPYLEKAIALNPAFNASHANLGWAYVEKGAYETAIPYLKRAIELDQTNAWPYANLGRAFIGKKEHDAAIPFLTKAIELNPKLDSALDNLGWAYIETGHYGSAIPVLTKAIAINPSNQVSENNLGHAYNEMEQYDAAIPHLKKAIELDPKFDVAYNNLGKSFNMKGDYRSAIPYLKKAIELNPKLEVAHNNLGYAYCRGHEYEAAIPHLKKAVELNSQYDVALNNLGWAYIGKREFSAAIPYLRKAIELNSKNMMAYTNLGQALNGKGDYGAAITFLSKAIEMNPHSDVAHNLIAVSNNMMGDYDSAIPHLMKAINLNPRNVLAHNNIGYAFNGKGEYERAIPYLKKAVELDSNDEAALSNLCSALNETGRLAEVRDLRQQMLGSTAKQSARFESEKNALADAECLLSIAQRLPDIVKRDAKATDFRESLNVGDVCRFKQSYVSSVRFYVAATAGADPEAKKFDPIDFFYLARAAVLAADGKGNERVPEVERAKYRVKALSWLQLYVNDQRRKLKSDPNGCRYHCLRNVRALLQHKDLGSVRPLAIHKLPSDEQKGWERFWTDVNDLIAQAERSLPGKK